MNSEERDLISHFIARVGGGVGAQTALPPIDTQANQFIAENFKRYPDSAYRITQLAMVEEAALGQAQNRIRDLEFQLQQARTQNAQLQAQLQQGQQAPQAGQQHQGGGFFSNLFGRGQQPQQPNAPYPPQPQGQMPAGWGAGAAPRPGGFTGGGYPAGPAYAPQAGMFPRSGSGFLGSALSTAAGVAGGVMAANALEGLFSGHHGADAAGGAAAGGLPDSGTFAGGAGDAGAGASASDPFGGAGTSAGGFSQQDFGGQGQDYSTQDYGNDQSFGGDDYSGGDGGYDDSF